MPLCDLLLGSATGAGIDLRTVQERGGSQSVAMIQKCADLAPAHRVAAVEALVRLPERSRYCTEAERAQVWRQVK